MKKYDAQSIRNVCLLSHGGVGKTTLLEALCFTAGATKRQGMVGNGTSIFDTRADEKERKMTISMAIGTCEWNNVKINFVDTPGFLDLLGDARAALQVTENALILIDAVAGIQVGTELVSRLTDGSVAKRMFFVNGLDKENVNFSRIMESMKEAYGSGVASLHIPIGSGADFKGIIDLISKEAFIYTSGGNGKGTKGPLPQEMIEKVDEMRSKLMESIAESDEELMGKYFEHGELSEEEMRKGLVKGILTGNVMPVFCGCAIRNIGVDLLLNYLVSCGLAADSRKSVPTVDKGSFTCSASAPAAGFVFKTLSEEHVGEINIVRVFGGALSLGQEVVNKTKNTTERLGNIFFLRGQERLETDTIPYGDIGGFLKLKDTHTNDTLAEKGSSVVFEHIIFDQPLVNVAIESKDKSDEEKIGAGLKKLAEEDPTFIFRFYPDIHQSILSTMGDIHTEIILNALKNRFKVEVKRIPPKISYRETVTKTVKYVEYTHKKQSGGAGQYARVFIDLEPLPRSGGYEYADKIVGGVIDQSFRPSVDKGVRAKMQEGILAGYPIVDVRVSLVDGKTHPVDSKDIAFQIAGREVFKKAFEMASPILLEPIVNLTVTIPDEFTGDVMGDLSSRRGKISGMKATGKYQTINAKVPESEIQTYSQALRSITQGRGVYSKTFSHYDPVPAEVAQKIIDSSKPVHKEVE